MKVIRRLMLFILICAIACVSGIFYLLKINDMDMNRENIQILVERFLEGKRITSTPNYVYGRAICDGLSFYVDQEQARNTVLHVDNYSDKTYVLKENSSFRVRFENSTSETDNKEYIQITPGQTCDFVLKWKKTDDEMPMISVENIYTLLEDDILSVPFDVYFPMVIYDPSDDYERLLYPTDNVFNSVAGTEFQEEGFCSIKQDANKFITAHYYSFNDNNIMSTIQTASLTTDKETYINAPHANIVRGAKEFFFTYYYPECEGTLQRFSNELFNMDLTEIWNDVMTDAAVVSSNESLAGEVDLAQVNLCYEIIGRYNLRKSPGVEGELIKTLDEGTICYGTGQYTEARDWTQIRLESSETGWISSAALNVQTGDVNHKETAEIAKNIDCTMVKQAVWKKLYHSPIQDTIDYDQMSIVGKTNVILKAIASDDETVLNQYSNMKDNSEILSLLPNAFSSTESKDGIKCVYAEYDTTIDGLDIYRTVLEIPFDYASALYVMFPCVYRNDRFISLLDYENIIEVANALVYMFNMLGFEKEAKEVERYYRNYMETMAIVEEYSEKVNEYNQHVDEYNKHVKKYNKQVKKWNKMVKENSSIY